MNIIGISAFYHDSAVALVADGQVIAAAQEEWFTRKKHDAAFPLNALRYCLAEGNVLHDELDAVVFYDKPLSKFHRILETYFSASPGAVKSFVIAMPLWLKQKLWIPMEIEKNLEQCDVCLPVDLFFAEHHESHAASAFFPSPFEQAAILTIDGVGEWATASLAHGRNNRIEILAEMHFPHSLGLLYSAFTSFTGFKVNSGEYKLMGLAPYGNPAYVRRIYDHLLNLKSDGSFMLNMDYVGYLDGLRMTNDRFAALFDGPARLPESHITQREMDLARSVQQVAEEIVLRMARHARRATGERCLCLAGGVALNCVANGKLLREHIFDDIWIQPAAGDAGGALGAALLGWHQVKNKPRAIVNGRDQMKGSYLGPGFTSAAIKTFLDAKGYVYHELNEDEYAKTVAQKIAEQQVIGLFNGRMEFGPRALGARSIIADVRSSGIQSVMNLKIKCRESFRPFAPSCLEECADEFFELDRPSPYMLLTAQVRRERCYTVEACDDFQARINQVRSDIPAVTHVDFSARVQTVSRATNPKYYAIIEAFRRKTGYGLIINTSFNVRGEPIVCTPEEAYRCFMRTEMDCLVLENYLLLKDEQPEWPEQKDWHADFALD